MTEEEQELLSSYQQEIEMCFKISQKLDALNPKLAGSFAGTPSERIERQLYALGIFKMTEQQLKELITPEFLSTLRTILKHTRKYPNGVGIDWNEVDFLPGVLEDFVTGDYDDD